MTRNPDPFNVTPIPPSVSKPSVVSTSPTPASTWTKGQWAALAVAGGTLVLAVVMGFVVFTALDGVHLTRLSKSLGEASDLLTVALIAAVALFGTLLAHIVFLFRVRPRLVSTLGLVSNLVLPPLVAMIGLKAGIESLIDHMNTEVLVPGASGLESFQQLIAGSNVDASWAVSLIEFLLKLAG